MQSVATAAGIAKDAVSYAEAHGTGTVVGDPIEANAIGDVFGGRDRATPLYVGSSKPNLGHLEPAAGIAGLIKAALVLHHRKIPPSLGFDRPNPKIHFDEHRLVVNDHLVDLPPSDLPAHALVNSFGFGGTNACALLSEASTSEPARVVSVTEPDRSTTCSGRPGDVGRNSIIRPDGGASARVRRSIAHGRFGRWSAGQAHTGPDRRPRSPFSAITLTIAR